MKRLIVNADDFGLLPNVTDGILEAHDRGIVRTCSLVTTTEDAPRAARLAQRRRNLAVGVHLALVEVEPCLDPERVPSLVGPQGSFRSTHTDFAKDYIRGRIRLEEVAEELRAQIERAQQLGIEISHLDSHQHLHMMPSIFSMTLKLCHQFGIPRIRIPQGGLGEFRSFSIGGVALQGLCWRARRSMARVAAPEVCDSFLGLRDSCRLTERGLIGLLERVRDGTTELMCHPGHGGLSREKRYAWANWEEELAALVSPAAVKCVRRFGITLASSL